MPPHARCLQRWRSSPAQLRSPRAALTTTTRSCRAPRSWRRCALRRCRMRSQPCEPAPIAVEASAVLASRAVPDFGHVDPAQAGTHARVAGAWRVYVLLRRAAALRRYQLGLLVPEPQAVAPTLAAGDAPPYHWRMRLGRRCGAQRADDVALGRRAVRAAVRGGAVAAAAVVRGAAVVQQHGVCGAEHGGADAVRQPFGEARLRRGGGRAGGPRHPGAGAPGGPHAPGGHAARRARRAAMLRTRRGASGGAAPAAARRQRRRPARRRIRLRGQAVN